jgi:soluble lytic murein transglycosylase-like protein
MSLRYSIVLLGVALAGETLLWAESPPRPNSDDVMVWTERLIAEAARRAELAEQAAREQAVQLTADEPPDVTLERAPSTLELPLPDLIRKILADEGLPPNLIALAQVESGLSPLALSTKGARGIWQLMPDTARAFGLTVDSRRDDRTDPVKSTIAAARFLRSLYSEWGDWNLAFAAYNAGPGAVARAAAGTESWSPALQRRLPEETREYVPKVWREIYRLDPAGLPDQEIQQ